MEVLFTPSAEEDVVRILQDAVDFPGAASRFRADLRAATVHLSAFPDTMTRKPELTRRNVSFWLMKPYWIIAVREPGMLQIVGVFHCSRKLAPLLRKSLKPSHD